MGYAAHSHRNFVQVHVFRSLWFWLFWQCESSEIKYVFLSMMPPTGHAQSYSCSCTRSPLDTLVKCGLFLCLLSPCLQLPLSCHHFFFFSTVGAFTVGALVGHTPVWGLHLYFFLQVFMPSWKGLLGVRFLVITMSKLSVVCLPLVYL